MAKVKIEVLRSVSSPSVYALIVDDHRVAGPKAGPWNAALTFHVSPDVLATALGLDSAEMREAVARAAWDLFYRKAYEADDPMPEWEHGEETDRESARELAATIITAVKAKLGEP